MPPFFGPRPQQSPDRIIDVASWSQDEINPIFPVGSKPKRLLKCPENNNDPFLVPGHRYLYKVAQDWREQQTWSEVLAYEIGKSLDLPVPSAFIAIDSSEGSTGVLVEFFYGYPNDPTPPNFLHGTDYLQRIRRGASFDPNSDRPHSVQMNIRVCSTVGVSSPIDWWAKVLTFDALIGNTDRHSQNWGFLVSRIQPEEISLDLAPMFDNGTSLGYEFNDQRLSQKLSADQMNRYIERGRHHCSWDPKDVSGGSHIELVKMTAKSEAAAGIAAQNVIRLTDSTIDALTAWCVAFDAPLKFSEDRADFVSQQLRARRDALKVAIG